MTINERDLALQKQQQTLEIPQIKKNDDNQERGKTWEQKAVANASAIPVEVNLLQDIENEVNDLKAQENNEQGLSNENSALETALAIGASIIALPVTVPASVIIGAFTLPFANRASKEVSNHFVDMTISPFLIPVAFAKGVYKAVQEKFNSSKSDK